MEKWVYNPYYNENEDEWTKPVNLNNELEFKLKKLSNELNEKMHKIAEIMGFESIQDLPLCVYASVVCTHLGLDLPRWLETTEIRYAHYDDGRISIGDI